MADKRLALLKRANKLFRQGKTEAAVKEYMKILAIKPDDLEVRRIVGDLQLRQDNTREAVEQFEWIADYYLKEGFFAKAIAMYKRITRVNPTYEEALFKLAELYTKQGLVIEAKQIYLDIAEECKRQNNQKKALGMYKKILEFDRSNIKMRTLLADNYLKEGMEDNAVEEYVTAADILLAKKDYRRTEEFLLQVVAKIKKPVLIEKLLHCYTAQNDDEKAISLLNEIGDELFKNPNLLKVLGELYLKQNRMDEAEKVFIKIAELNPEETEVIMRLGKVYLQREEYDKTYELFLPVVNKNMTGGLYDEAASLLRFIIASNNAYLPALTKLADVFRVSGKNNNLIALYESLIPIYENKGLNDRLKDVLEKLIELSDTPFTYEEQLEKLTGRDRREKEEADEDEREDEFIAFNLRAATEAIQDNDYDKALAVLIKAKTTFPRNVAVRQKLFDVYHTSGKEQEAVDEGKGLLDMYKAQDMRDEYTELFDKLTALKPDDAKILELSGDEKTSIDIDFQPDELVEELQAIDDGQMHEPEPKLEDSASGELMVLADDHSLSGFELQEEEDHAKSLTTCLSELDFYINDKYFSEAERLLDGLKVRYAGNPELAEWIQRLEEAKKADGGPADGDTVADAAPPMELEAPLGAEPAVEEVKAHTEQIIPAASDDFVIEPSGGGDSLGYEASNVEIDLGDMDGSGEQPMTLSLADSADSVPVELAPLDVDMEGMGTVEPEPSSPPAPDFDSGPVFELHTEEPSEQAQPAAEAQPADRVAPGEPDVPAEPPAPAEPDDELMTLMPESVVQPSEAPVETSLFDDSPFEIESSISEESGSAQEHENTKADLKREDVLPPETIKVTAEPAGEDIDFEVEFEEPPVSDETDHLPAVAVDPEMLIQSPSAAPREQSAREHSTSGVEEFDLDSIMMDEGGAAEAESPFKEAESPFKDITGQDLAFEADEDLLEDGAMFLDEPFFENEKNVAEEMEAIIFWLKEVEKQRTSTIEKNMMEIFDEFKRGVDEKIGQEDYDTRYNLGIAYKEMGLLEEAIHEFLISSKHQLKFFDSAGLLGMCFREKGMFTEAINWFEKAVVIPDRKKEEYLAVKFELVMTYRLQEDFKSALHVAEDILRMDSGYRNITEVYQEIKRGLAQQQQQ